MPFLQFRPVQIAVQRTREAGRTALMGPAITDLMGNTRQTVALNVVRRPNATPIHELERYMRCKDCSRLQGRPYKRSHLVALRSTMISADDPPSMWWPEER